MKAFLKYLCVFLLGAAVALGVASVFLPPRLTAIRAEINGPEISWTLEDFVTVNDELSRYSGAERMISAVTPMNSGYQIHISDSRLRARFGFGFDADWDRKIDAITARMEELRAENE